MVTLTGIREVPVVLDHSSSPRAVSQTFVESATRALADEPAALLVFDEPAVGKICEAMGRENLRMHDLELVKTFFFDALRETSIMMAGCFGTTSDGKVTRIQLHVEAPSACDTRGGAGKLLGDVKPAPDLKGGELQELRERVAALERRLVNPFGLRKDNLTIRDIGFGSFEVSDGGSEIELNVESIGFGDYVVTGPTTSGEKVKLEVSIPGLSSVNNLTVQQRRTYQRQALDIALARSVEN